MGVFSINNINDYLNECDEIPCEFEDCSEATYNMITESEYNYNKMIQAIGIQELHALEETGKEMIYETKDIKSFIQKAKQFFINIWKKIQGLFTKFFATIEKYTKTDKEFLSKYKKLILKGSVKDLKYKGYDYTVDAISLSDSENEMSSYIDNIIGNPKTDNEYKSQISKLSELDDVKDNLRGKSLNNGSSYNQSEFAKELFSKLRNGEQSKKSLDNLSKDKYIKIIQNTKKIQDKAKNNYKELKNNINKIIKELNIEEKNLLKDDDENIETQSLKIKYVGDKIALYKTELSILSMVNSAILKALKDENRQAKSICVKIINRKDPKNESFIQDGNIFGENGILSNVDFI